MKIFKYLSGIVHYTIDSLLASSEKIKIEKFQFETHKNTSIVVYRIGNKKILNRMPIQEFQIKYFDKCLNYDRYRLVKFSTLQLVLDQQTSSDDKKNIINIIIESANNEQLF